MRTTTRTVIRKEHWRWQRCGVGRSELRHVRVRECNITLTPEDTRQLDLLEASSRAHERTTRRRITGRGGQTSAPRTVLRSYWRNQPFGPRSGLRKLILVDVTR